MSMKVDWRSEIVATRPNSCFLFVLPPLADPYLCNSLVSLLLFVALVMSHHGMSHHGINNVMHFRLGNL
jgi:hypothetical protein